MKYLGQPQSGSMAAITASRNRYGQYLRARTGRGGTPLISLAGADADWNTLTDAQRLSWASWASELVRRDSLGQVNELTGREAFIGQWLRSQWVGLTPLVDPPAGWDRGQITALTMVDVGSGVVDVTASWLGDAYLQEETTSAVRAENAGVSRPPGRDHWWRHFLFQAPLGPGPSSTFTGPTPAPAYTPGQKTWVRARTVHVVSRLSSPWVMAGPIVLS